MKEVRAAAGADPTGASGARAHAKGLGSAAAIFDARGRVLLVQHTYGRRNWELPGVVVERGESPVQAVVREVREETGLQVDVLAVTGCYYEPVEDLVHFVFRCRAAAPANPVADQVEIAACGWWPVADLPRPISDFTVRRIQDATGPVNLPLPEHVGPRTWIE